MRTLLRRLPTPRRQRLVLAACALVAVGACQAVRNFNLIPVSQDPVLGAEAYPQLLADERTIGSGADLAMVRRTMDNLVVAAETFHPDVVEMFEWEVRLVDDDQTVNAWALPGGKMAVYTGILPVARTEAGLAVVMGHEIAHATRRHGTKAMSRQMGAQVLVQLASVLVFEDADDQAVAAAAGSIAANFASLKFGRDAELEADAWGLKYMARAGYDPREAVGFWERMQSLAGGGAGPEWLSTHPSHGRRIDQIESLLPDALAIYEQNGQSK